MGYIVFEGIKYKKIALNIATGAPFHEILKKINSIGIQECNQEEEIRYAIMELVNNSLRAHRQNSIKEDIRTELKIQEGKLFVTITDKGPGFDIKNLPYNIETPAAEVDTNSIEFQRYREKHRYKHFGMGLLVARRQFPEFKITFFDTSVMPVTYAEGKVAGTRIEMSMRLNNG